MYSRLIIDGNAVYEIDEECLKQRQGRKGYGGKNRGTKSPLSSGETGGLNHLQMVVAYEIVQVG